MKTYDYATRQDVEEIVGRVVGEVVGDALQLIAGRFDLVDERFTGVDQELAAIKHDVNDLKQDVYDLKHDIRDLYVITTRIDNRLEENIETTKLHSAQIRQMQRKIA